MDATLATALIGGIGKGSQKTSLEIPTTPARWRFSECPIRQKLALRQYRGMMPHPSRLERLLDALMLCPVGSRSMRLAAQSQRLKPLTKGKAYESTWNAMCNMLEGRSKRERIHCPHRNFCQTVLSSWRLGDLEPLGCMIRSDLRKFSSRTFCGNSRARSHLLQIFNL